MHKALNATRHAIELDGRCLPIVIRRRRGSRRMVIRYQPLAHALSLTLPSYVTVRQGLRFVEEKRDWIVRELRENQQQVPLADGEIIPVLERNLRLCHVGGRGLVRREEERLLIPGEAEFLGRRVRDWLKSVLREEISRLASEKARRIGKDFRKVTLRDTISSWGSCTKDGNLSFSWRLVFAPQQILDYVVSHEIAHLAYLDHSADFWRVVEELCPDFQAHRGWLRKNGAQLYVYR